MIIYENRKEIQQNEKQIYMCVLYVLVVSSFYISYFILPIIKRLRVILLPVNDFFFFFVRIIFLNKFWISVLV